MKKFKLILGSITFSVLLIACAKDEVTETTVDACGDENYTYDDNVASIINENCTACHTTGGTFPSLTTFSEVEANLSRVKARAITDKTMPPSEALSDEDIKILNCWIEQGNQE